MSEETKEKNETKEEKNITLHEIKFIFLFTFEILILPLKLLFYLLKGDPKEAFGKLKKLLKEEFFQYHKQALILLLINTIVFLLFQIPNKFWQNLMGFIFISGPWNLYLFNLSFIAHQEFEHFLGNMLFLYNVAYVLSFRFNVIKLYFIFGFLLNLLIFITSFFINNLPPSLGASGVISALMIVSIVFYPFGFSLFLFLIYLLFFTPFSYVTIDIFKTFNFASDITSLLTTGIVSNDRVFTLDHVYGYFLGLAYVLLKWKELKTINKIVFFLLLLIPIFLIIKYLVHF